MGHGTAGGTRIIPFGRFYAVDAGLSFQDGLEGSGRNVNPERYGLRFETQEQNQFSGLNPIFRARASGGCAGAFGGQRKRTRQRHSPTAAGVRHCLRSVFF